MVFYENLEKLNTLKSIADNTPLLLRTILIIHLNRALLFTFWENRNASSL